MKELMISSSLVGGAGADLLLAQKAYRGNRIMRGMKQFETALSITNNNMHYQLKNLSSMRVFLLILRFIKNPMSILKSLSKMKAIKKA